MEMGARPVQSKGEAITVDMTRLFLLSGTRIARFANCTARGTHHSFRLFMIVDLMYRKYD